MNKRATGCLNRALSVVSDYVISRWLEPVEFGLWKQHKVSEV